MTPRSNSWWQEKEIRIQNVADAQVASRAIKQSFFSKIATKPKTKRTSLSFPKIAGYTVAFIAFVGVIALGYQSPKSVDNQFNQAVSLATTSSTTQLNNAVTPSVDQMVATDVAANLTEQANLPIAPAVANTAVSLSAQNELAQTDDATISKPQIIQPAEGNRALQYYVTTNGDDVKTVASKFNISAETVRWANNLTSDAIPVDKKLTILPVSGVLHTVVGGETIDTIAEKYRGSPARIISFNDLELSGPKEGQSLIIPDGSLPENERPGYRAPVTNNYYGSSNSNVISTSMARASAGNRYAFGNCTWYAYERRQQLGNPVGSFWGNASTWAINARAAGYVVNGTPSPGAVLVMPYGYTGHVAVVESVHDNGDVVVSEMNYVGFNVVSSRTISAGQAAGYEYIH